MAEPVESIELSVNPAAPPALTRNDTAGVTTVRDDEQDLQLDKADLRFERAQRTQRLVVGAMWVASIVTVIGSLVVGIDVRDLVHKNMPAVMDSSFDFVELGLARVWQISVAFTTIFDPSLLGDLGMRYDFTQYDDAGTVSEGQRFWDDILRAVEGYSERISQEDLAPETRDAFVTTYVPFLGRQIPWEAEGMQMAFEAGGNETLLIEAQKYMSVNNSLKDNDIYFNTTVLTGSLVAVEDANKNDLARLRQESVDVRKRAVKWGVAGVVVLGIALLMALLTTRMVNAAQLRLKRAIKVTRKRLLHRVALDGVKIVSPRNSVHPKDLFTDDDDSDDETDSHLSDSSSMESSDMAGSRLSDAFQIAGSAGSTGTGSDLESNGAPATGTGTGTESGTRSQGDWRRRSRRALQQKERVVSVSLLLCWLLLLTSTVLFWVQAERAEDDIHTADVQVQVATRSYKVASVFESAWSAVMLTVSAKEDGIRGLYSEMSRVTLGQFEEAWLEILELSDPPQSTIDSADAYMDTLATIADKTAGGGNSSSVAEARELFVGELQEHADRVLEHVVPLRDGIVADVAQVTQDVQDSINTALVIAISALVIGLLVIVFAAAAENKRVEVLQLLWTARTWSLERVIDNPDLRAMLHKQAHDVYSGENIEFLVTYRMAARNGLKDTDLVELYRRFLHSNSSEMLNVSDHLRSTVVKLFKGVGATRGDTSAAECSTELGEAGAPVPNSRSDGSVRIRRLRELAKVHAEVSKLVTTNLLQTFLESSEFATWRREYRARAETEIKLLQKRADLSA
ncbi:MAG: hypothetical protein MHM6MM_001070 [Cercozoa sp. M6MM]